jgi:hypothetical protein
MFFPFSLDHKPLISGSYESLTTSLRNEAAQLLATGRQRLMVAGIGGATLAVFVLDNVFPLGFVIPALYLLPIILTTRVHLPLAPFVMAACATVLTLIGIWTSWSPLWTSPADSLQPGLFNRLLVILASWIAAMLIWHTTPEFARRELETLVTARTAALRQSKSALESFFNSADLMMGVVEIVEDQLVMVIANHAATSA